MGFALGKEIFKYGLCLAPMAGYSDSAMREVCHTFGAELAVTEMISARAVAYGDKKTLRLAKIGASEGAVALQIFGSEPSVLAEAAAKLSLPIGEEYASPVAIDINMGCPVNKIFNNGDGSALMRSPTLIYDIVRAASRATALPITVKLRLGIDRDNINATECALAAEEGGASLLTLHGRTRADMYSGLADREKIAKVKEAIRIPLVANGDVTSGESALDMLSVTGADGIAVGRGAVGNPFIFSEILAVLRGEEIPSYTRAERVETAIRELRLAVADKGERVAIPESRGRIAAYIRAFPGAARIRERVNTALTLAEIEKILTESIS